MSRKKIEADSIPALTGEEVLWLKWFLCVKTMKGALGESDELAYPGRIERDVLWRGKASGKKEFLKVGQYIAFH